MDEPLKRIADNVGDSIQQRLTEYAFGLNYEALPTAVVHAAKIRIIDTLGSLIGGFFGDPCRIARDVAAQMPDPSGATILGTRWKCTPDMAAFVNAITSRNAELNDNYHAPGSAHGHPSETITSVLAIAEHAQVSGRELIAGVVLSYEVFLRISDVFPNVKSFDTTNFGCISTAVAAGKLLGLSPKQLAHCISMAAVPNVILKQASKSPHTMFKAVACGHAGRAGVFAALLARAGMEGPHLPFVGKAGWCNQVACESISLDKFGGNGTPFKIGDTQIKTRPAAGGTIGCILAAEKISPFRNVQDITNVIVEVPKAAKDQGGTGDHPWNPDSREVADHSIPYNVAVTLKEGTVTLRSFNDSHLWNPELRALMKKIEVVENKEFTEAFARIPVEHRTRVTVETGTGERLMGETGGGEDDISAPKSDMQIEGKFRSLAEEYLGAKRVNDILNRLWHLEEAKSAAEIPPMLVLN